MPSASQSQRWMIVGAGGMLGHDLIAVLEQLGADAIGLRHADLDVTDAGAARRALAGADVVVNAAAWTDVDGAETHEAEAFAVNATGASNVARAARLAGARLVHVSTDYVFDGHATRPYSEDDRPVPPSVYGRSKIAGERIVRDEAFDHLIVRTAWLYGAHGGCFPKTMARLATERDQLAVVEDQVGQPTWTRDLAELIVRLVAVRAPAGIYHGTSSGQTSWYEFARRVVASAGLSTPVEPTTSDKFPRPAPRPAYSVLGHDALHAAGVEPIGHWAERWDLAAPEVLA